MSLILHDKKDTYIADNTSIKVLAAMAVIILNLETHEISPFGISGFFTQG